MKMMLFVAAQNLCHLALCAHFFLGYTHSTVTFLRLSAEAVYTVRLEDILTVFHADRVQDFFEKRGEVLCVYINTVSQNFLCEDTNHIIVTILLLLFTHTQI